MKAFIIYQAEVAICLALFYGFFHVFLKNEVQFQTRRFYFIFSFLVAFLIPGLEIAWTFEKELPTLPIEYIYSFTPYQATSVQEVTSWSVWNTLFLIWLIGFVIMIFRLVISLIKIRHILSHTNKLEGNVRTIDSEVQSFSFFHWVVINQRHYESQAKPYIMDHELAHSRQYHSIDILLMEITKCLQWFNPFAWMLGSRMILNLEFLADQTVLNRHQNLKEYQVSLLQFANAASYKPLKIEFSKLHLKQRFKMMGRSVSNIHPIKGLGLLILLLMMGFTFSVKGIHQEITQQVTESVNRLVDETSSEKLPVEKDASITVNGKVLGGSQPISGASIIAKTLNLGTITDKDGDFTLLVPRNTQLTIAYPGYVTNHHTVNPTTDTMSLGIILVKENKPEKEGPDDTGSVTDVKAFDDQQGEKEFKSYADIIEPNSAIWEAPSFGNVDKNLTSGKVKIRLSSKLADSSSHIGLYHHIDPFALDMSGINRRKGYINGNEYPLFIIAGVEYEGEEGIKQLEKIGHETIESVSVSKGQSAKELYGDKAKNGVVFVKLKDELWTNTMFGGTTSLWGKGKKGISIAYDKTNLSPIYIINGVEFTHEEGLQELDNIKITDVEKVHLFESKAAIKKYGEKGEKGVIIIELKD